MQRALSHPLPHRLSWQSCEAIVLTFPLRTRDSAEEIYACLLEATRQHQPGWAWAPEPFL